MPPQASAYHAKGLKIDAVVAPSFSLNSISSAKEKEKGNMSMGQRGRKEILTSMVVRYALLV